MLGECPTCANGKITSIWPVAKETLELSLQRGKLKLMCFDALHEFEMLLPEDPEQKARLLHLAFPTASH